MIRRMRTKMSNVRSAKAKGRRLQNAVRDALRSAFPALHEDDIKSQNSGEHSPILVVKRNRTKIYAVLEFDKFIGLIKE
mgnify:CR=1 FL=1